MVRLTGQDTANVARCGRCNPGAAGGAKARTPALVRSGRYAGMELSFFRCGLLVFRDFADA